MPLVVISGQPCSGKSQTAAELAGVLRDAGHQVVVVSDESVGVSRCEAYKDGHAEKVTRGLLRSAVDRALTRSSTVIVDSLNSIKGYRYELWCIARGMGTRYALLHVSTPLEVCQQWNAARPAQEAYSPAVMQDLGGRYERPDTRNRWDAPLITVQPQRSSMEMQEALHLVRAAVDVSARESGPTRGLATKELSPTIATSTPALASTNLLHEIDQATQMVIERIMEAQTASASGIVDVVQVAEGVVLRMHRQMPLQELRRHKRSFMKLATNLVLARAPDATAARRMFVEYLQEHLNAT